MNRVAKIVTLALMLPCFFVPNIAAEELDSRRLFHEPLTTKEIVIQSNQSPVRLDDTPALPRKRTAYRYSGFMSTEFGRQFIVNGINLSELENLELLLVIDSGRSLKLRTAKGYVFTLAMGETVSVGPKLASKKNE